ncbi:MAG: hypothetical protein R2692_06720 [Microbacterium sp.]
MHALAVTDHDGFYGIVRFAEAAEQLHVKTVFGAELPARRRRALAEAPRAAPPTPTEPTLLVLARGEEAITGSPRRSRTPIRRWREGPPALRPRRLRRAGGRAARGCALGCGSPDAARRGAPGTGIRGAARPATPSTCSSTGSGGAQSTSNSSTTAIPPTPATTTCSRASPSTVAGLLATNNVHYAVPDRVQPAAAVAAVRQPRPRRADGWLPCTRARICARAPRWRGAFAAIRARSRAP